MSGSLAYSYIAVILFLCFYIYLVGVTFAFFQSRGTCPISILPLKISHNGEAIAEDTSLNIEELKLSIPGALFGFIFDSFSCTIAIVNSIVWSDSSIVFVKIFTGSGKLLISSSVYIY